MGRGCIGVALPLESAGARVVEPSARAADLLPWSGHVLHHEDYRFCATNPGGGSGAFPGAWSIASASPNRADACRHTALSAPSRDDGFPRPGSCAGRFPNRVAPRAEPQGTA